MEIYEYVSVLTSIIIGLGLAHLLRGLVRIVQHPDRYPVYWVHLGWVVYMFFMLVFWWWWQFTLVDLESFTFLNYLFVVFYAFNLFAASALLFPEDLEGYEGFKDYFYERKGWFFGLLAFTSLIDYIDTLLKGTDYFFGLGWEYIVMNAVLGLVQLTAIFVSRERFHQVLMLAVLAYQVSWAVRMYATVA